MSEIVFHLLANAHLDPVWLWDWREGLNEGTTTCRTMLDLMDEYPDFTFIRGEASIYRHIEESDPETFARIGQRVREGRWDIVGGNWVQSDTNLPATTTFLKQFEIGKSYFRDAFGVDVAAAWAADSFGHSAGLPEIYAASGLKYFAFSRPSESICPIGSPAFRWRGQGGAEILCYRIPVGWYGCERDEIPRRLDGMLQSADKFTTRHQAVFFGLGNHGGGSSRRQLEDIQAWAQAHPEVKVEFSTLHRFFAALEKEVESKGRDVIPTFTGELNYCLRGCYSSVAKFKYLFRQAEGVLRRATRTAAAVAGSANRPCPDFSREWQGMAFNTFHDILPGSSIERAYEEQMQWLGGVIHNSREKEFAAFNALAARIDTRVKPATGDNPTAVPFVLFNPSPYEFRGHVELEASLDYRPLWPYRGRPDEVPVELLDADHRPLPFQLTATEHHAMADLPWRKRAICEMTIPPFGWRKVSLGYRENPEAAPAVESAVQAEGNAIANGIYRIEAVPGERQVRISRHGQPLPALGSLAFATYDDPWGSWGGMAEEPESFRVTNRVETWTISRTRLQESGPERASLWIEFKGAESSLQLTVQLYRGRDAVDCAARIIWNDRAVRLKMVSGQADEALYDIPGGTIARQESGDVPGGRWVKLRRGEEQTALIGNAFYCYDNENGEFGVTLCRGARYATDVVSRAPEYPDKPAADIGELKCRFIVTADHERAPVLAEQLEMPPIIQTVSPHAGALKDGGSILALAPDTVKLADFAVEDGGWQLCLQNQAEGPVAATVTVNGKAVMTPKLAPWQLCRFSLKDGCLTRI